MLSLTGGVFVAISAFSNSGRKNVSAFGGVIRISGLQLMPCLFLYPSCALAIAAGCFMHSLAMSPYFARAPFPEASRHGE